MTAMLQISMCTTNEYVYVFLTHSQVSLVSMKRMFLFSIDWKIEMLFSGFICKRKNNRFFLSDINLVRKLRGKTCLI